MTIHRSLHRFVDRKANRDFEVEVEIDMDILAHMLATRVLNSKRGKTKTARGAIKARIVPEIQPKKLR